MSTPRPVSSPLCDFVMAQISLRAEEAIADQRLSREQVTALMVQKRQEFRALPFETLANGILHDLRPSDFHHC